MPHEAGNQTFNSFISGGVGGSGGEGRQGTGGNGGPGEGPTLNHFTEGEYVAVHHYYAQPDREIARNRQYPSTLDIIDDSLSQSQIYCNQLLRQGRGIPLYDPEPRHSLPLEYQMSGVAIGDVGRITPEGSFDFFFNIYLPADHPINNNSVPEGFCPLALYESRDLYKRPYLAGNHISTSTVKRLDTNNVFPGGNFIFDCHGPQGAVLALPHGSHLRKLENLEALRKYAAIHAKNWFEYVNGQRGRGLGSLYLVTGCEKIVSWGRASFHSHYDPFQLSFTTVTGIDQYQWIGNPAHIEYHNTLSPIHDTPRNQTIFVQGLSVSLGTGILARLVPVRIHEAINMESRSGSASGSSTHGSSLLSRLVGFFAGGPATDGTHARQYEGAILSDIPPVSQIFHPGELINSYILKKVPQAAVVMSHDDDWCDILADGNEESQVHSVSEFLQRVSDRYEITQKDGATFLLPLDTPSTSENLGPTPSTLDASLDGPLDAALAPNRANMEQIISSDVMDLDPIIKPTDSSSSLKVMDANLPKTPGSNQPVMSRPSDSTLMQNADMSVAAIYCNQLLRQGRGIPLYDPEPRQSLPLEYQARGVAIGDVGRITPEGSFDFFFNIYLPADHPINKNDVPEGFCPLVPYESQDLYERSCLAGNHISSSTVKRLDTNIVFPGDNFVFDCHGPQGAVLALPHGSHLRKLENLEALRKYAAIHAKNWFEYVNGQRGRGLGSLCLVTGCEKTAAWGIASFHGVEDSFHLSFDSIDGSRRYRWKGNPTGKKHHDLPIHEPNANQTIFIHGLTISLGTGFWAWLFGQVQIGDIVDRASSLGDAGPKSYVHGSSLFSWAASRFRGRAATT